MEIAKVYPLDAVYDSPEDVPEDVRTEFFQSCGILTKISFIVLI